MSNIDKESLESYIKGSIVGLLVADALAYPYKNVPNIKDYEIEMVAGLHGETVGSWTSVGAFNLATMASINEYDGILLDDLIEKLNNVYIGGLFCPDAESKDIGPVTAQSLANFSNDFPLDSCGSKDQTLDGDCLLRILPVALYYSTHDINEIIDQAHKVCSITHADIYSQVCCSAFCLIVRNILLQKAEKIFDLLFDFYQQQEMTTHSDLLLRFKEMRNSKHVSNTRNIDDIFWGAWSIHSCHEQNFKQALVSSIYLGGDTNNRTAIIGVLSGLTNSLEGIPNDWLSKLNINSEAMSVIQNFVDSVLRKFNADR